MGNVTGKEVRREWGLSEEKAGRIVWERKWEKSSLALRIFEKVMWKLLLKDS